MNRLRELAERPLDPATGRIVVLLAGAVCIGFAVLVGLGLTGPQGTGSPRPVARPKRASLPDLASSPPATPRPRPSHHPATGRRTQDPQDRPGSLAARRAARELETHRALQHVPWHRGGASIRLVGARGTKAVLAVRARSLADARRAYRAFLRRFHDAGRSYLPRLEADRTRPDHRGGRR